MALNSDGDVCWTETYAPYGEKLENEDQFPPSGCGLIGQERGYTGRTHNPATDLTYMMQRYFDPVAGRILSVDPVLPSAPSPITQNRYAYAANNPYGHVDPDGELPVLLGAYYAVTGALTLCVTYQAYK